MASSSQTLSANLHRFLTAPDDSLKCPVCLEVAVEPWQHGKCGRLFCRQCLEEYGKEKPCPNCRRQRPEYFEDTKSKREIGALRVTCGHTHQPCGWEGTLGTLEEHTKDKECRRQLVQCPNTKCMQEVERDMLERHIQLECGYTVISCKYQDIGCDLKLKRHDMLGHEHSEDKMHLHMALEAVVALKKTVAQLEEKNITLKHGESMVLKVTEFSHRKSSNDIFRSPPFYTGANGYCMMVQIHPNGCGYGRGTHVSIYTRVLQGKHDRELSWPFVGTLKVWLLNQLEDSNHHVKCIKPALQSFDVDTGTTRGCAKFIPHPQLVHDPVNNIQYLRNDTLYLRLLVEVPDHKPWLE